jgi:hypothetical protein
MQFAAKQGCIQEDICKITQDDLSEMIDDKKLCLLPTMFQ